MSKRQSTEYESTDLRILMEGNDFQVTALCRGISDIERCQELLKAECQGEARHWVIGKLERQLKEIREYDILD